MIAAGIGPFSLLFVLACRQFRHANARTLTERRPQTVRQRGSITTARLIQCASAIQQLLTDNHLAAFKGPTLTNDFISFACVHFRRQGESIYPEVPDRLRSESIGAD